MAEGPNQDGHDGDCQCSNHQRNCDVEPSHRGLQAWDGSARLPSPFPLILRSVRQSFLCAVLAEVKNLTRRYQAPFAGGRTLSNHVDYSIVTAGMGPIAL
jgi:hypothetical protein